MKVGIVVLSWNSRELITDCLEGLFRHEHEAVVYVVDNGSSDGSVEHIKCRFPSVNLICSPINLGFSDGNNLGMRRAVEEGCGAVILLNNDTIIDEPFVDKLIDFSFAHKTLGIVGPVVVEGLEPDLIQCAGGTINTWFARFSYRERGSRYSKSERYDSVDYVLGAAFLIKSDVIKKIGFLDQEYFPAYVEEADYCYRASRIGYKSAVYFGVRVRHLGGKSSGGTANEFRRMMNHRFLFAIKHAPHIKFIVAASAISLRVFFKKLFGI